MLRLSHGLVLAAVMLAASGAVSAYRSNWRPELFCEALSESLCKYGLFGLTASCNLQAADFSIGRAQSSEDSNPAAAGAARDVAARNLERAARILRSQGAEAHALRVLQRAWRLCPERADYRVSMLADQALGGDARAEGELQDLAFEDEDPHALVYVAGELASRGMSDDAGGLLKKASEVAPGVPEVQLAYGRWLLSTGDRTRSSQVAEAVLTSSPDAHDAAAAQDLLQQASGTPAPAPRSPAARIARDYGPTGLVLLLYLLTLCSPALASLSRRVGGGVRRRPQE